MHFQIIITTTIITTFIKTMTKEGLANQ